MDFSAMTGQPLTVLQVLPALESGGVERGVLEVAEALVKNGHRSLVASAGGRMVHALVSHGSEHFTAPIAQKTPWALSQIPWLRRLMIRERVDVVDIHSRFPGWLTWLAWKSLPAAKRPRLISTLHGLHSVNRYSEIMCSGEAVIVVSETVRDYVLKNYPRVPASKLKLIHRGIDEQEFPRGFRPPAAWCESFFAEFPHLRNQPLITLPGRITRLKGHEDFLRVMAALKAAGVSAHGLIVGGAEPNKLAYLNGLRRLVVDLGLQDSVTFTGQRRDLREIYAISKVVVSLSRTPESFGRTVAEALSIGTPVVGYNHGGVAEILAAQFAHGAVNTGDVTEVTNRVQELLAAPFSQFIKPNCFLKSEMLAKTLDVYRKISHGTHRAAS
jgi:glycosyltransferase involved in cell wall biosynthesis